MKKILDLSGKHWVIEAVRLNTATDFTDDVVTKSHTYLYRGNAHLQEGNIFFLRSAAKTYCVVTFSADFQVPSLSVDSFQVYLSDTEFEYTVLEGAEAELRRYLGQFAPEKLIAMSNTWGDCNGYQRVCDEFIKKELDAAKRIHLDIAQIDDGWAKGKTADRSIFDENGRRRFDGDFWETDRSRFPDGIEAIRDYARECGVRLGLWFAPDFHGNFAHFDRDVSILENANKAWECGFFKLDMLHIENLEDKARFEEMLKTLGAFASLELDVTCGKRLGYLLSLKYGIIFLENRYTKVGNYYPYRTLKNLWELSHYIPAACLQAEVANPDLNTDVYKDDELAPEGYTMDYLFATVLVSNPLFWMETQFLSESRCNELERILPVWRSIRDEIVKSEVVPIGQIPSGHSFSGFLIKGERTLAVVFREKTANDTFDFGFSQFRVLASNGRVEGTCGGISFSSENCYALVEVLG